MFQALPPNLQTPKQIISINMVTLCMLKWLMLRKSIGKKHLIQFPIGVDYKKVRNLMEPSTKYPTVLLKADIEADVNLMNLNIFDKLI